ncbi:MAG: PAS domain-containing protein [Chitinophagales bacterium]
MSLYRLERSDSWAAETILEQLDWLADGFWDCNLKTGEVFFSPRFKQVLGYSWEEIKPEIMSWRLLIHPEDYNAIGLLLDDLRMGGTVFKVECRLHTRQGEWKWFLCRGKVFERDFNGELVRLMGVHFDISKYRKSQEDWENKYRELLAAENSSNNEFQNLSHRLMQAQEEERRSLARELHDEIGQVLAAVKISLQTFMHAGITPPEKLQESIAIVEHTLDEVRRMSLALRPSLLDDLGLAAALRWHVDRQARLAGLTTHFTANIGNARLPGELETVCFRIVQEALNNILKHAEAGEVWINLCLDGPELQVTVRDDGKGFDVEEALRGAARGNSLGLLGLKERVTQAGGQAEIGSSPGEGTTIKAVFYLS